MIPDEHFYLQATREFESGILDEALRAKAMALVDDDEQKFKKQYISLRVTQLKKNSATRGMSHVLIVVSTWAAWLWIMWCIGAAIVMPFTERGTARSDSQPHRRHHWMGSTWLDKLRQIKVSSDNLSTQMRADMTPNNALKRDRKKRRPLSFNVIALGKARRILQGESPCREKRS
jgi:hypothetical protein